MKKKTLLFAVIVTLVGGLLWNWNYQRQRHMSTSTTFAMNTFIEQKWYGANSDEIVAEVNSLIAELEKELSMHISVSEIGAINAEAGHKPVKVSKRTFDLLKLAKDYSQKSQNAFDVTIGPLVELWGITGDSPHVPTKEELDKSLLELNAQALILDEENSTAFLEKVGMEIDLGGIAKGWACDEIRALALQMGAKSGYVSLGGNLMIIGDKPDNNPYRFGVRNPLGDETQALGVVTLKGKTMATSGGYERFFIENGVKYHHVLDPRTGYPADSDLLSVSVISPSGILADFLSTTFFVLGREKTLKCLDDSRFELIVVDNENRVYVSKSLQKDFIPSREGNTFDFTDYEN